LQRFGEKKAVDGTTADRRSANQSAGDPVGFRVGNECRERSLIAILALLLIIAEKPVANYCLDRLRRRIVTIKTGSAHRLQRHRDLAMRLFSAGLHRQ
jgi:hypothetical protein